MLKNVIFSTLIYVSTIGLVIAQPLAGKGPASEAGAASGIVIGTFKNIPKGIDGGACTFSLSKKDQDKDLYVLVNDMAELAFMLINGKMQKFELKKYVKAEGEYYYKHSKYSLRVRILKKSGGSSEGPGMHAELELTDLSGAKVIKQMIGTCGD
jgi:hypothetical protein